MPNNHCVRMAEDELPKEVTPLIEEGCPTCKTWDHLEDVTEILVLKYKDFRTAKQNGPTEYPGAIYLKASFAYGTERDSYRSMKDYLFAI